MPPLLDYKVALTEDWLFFPSCDFMEVEAYEPEAAAIFFCQSTGNQHAVVTVIEEFGEEYRVEVGSRTEYYVVGRAEQICKKCGYAMKGWHCCGGIC